MGRSMPRVKRARADRSDIFRRDAAGTKMPDASAKNRNKAAGWRIDENHLEASFAMSAHLIIHGNAGKSGEP